MSLLVMLRDVEEQFLRVTRVVELHLKLTEGSLECELGQLTSISEVLVLVGSVEGAQTTLATVTQRLVEIIKHQIQAPTPTLPDFDVSGDSAIPHSPAGARTDMKSRSEDIRLGLKSSYSSTGEVAATIAEVGSEHGEEGEPTAANLKNALQRYLAASSAIKNSIVVSQREPGRAFNVFENVSALSEGRWAQAVKQDFKEATKLFLKRLVSQSTNLELRTAFCEASELAVSIITLGTTDFNLAWIVPATISFDSVHAIARMTSFAQALFPLLECRNKLVRYVDERITKFLETTASSLSKVTQTSKKLKQLRKKIFMFVEKLRNICEFCTIRHDWLSESSIKSLEVCISGTKVARMVKELGKTLEKFEATYPARAPQLLFEVGDTNMADPPKEDDEAFTSSQTEVNLKISNNERSLSKLHPGTGTIHDESCGTKRARTDTNDGIPVPKRAARSIQPAETHNDNSDTSDPHGDAA
ncbi:hypothetical protein ON010_g3680 [Phytophthora cinnamomi]|nr:hypothetical protein ON010_g3680 [Phytophthora cinnamomi]